MLTAFQERSTKDAAAVKILTVITLIYLPTTIVAVSSVERDNPKYHANLYGELLFYSICTNRI
jgi:hypothetical protein